MHSRKVWQWLVIVGVVTSIASFAHPVRADQIDGNWCFKDGRTLSINGSSIVTPEGNSISGNYDRHSFSYVTPASEPNAGSMVAMTQLNQMTIQLTQETTAGSGKTSPVQVWKRCTPTTS